MNKETIIYASELIGFSNLKNWYYLPEMKVIKQKYYNGRICFNINGKIIGLATFRKNCKQVNIQIEECPF